LAYFTKKLSTAQQKYSTLNRELLAVLPSIRHFHFLLDGQKFCVYVHPTQVARLCYLLPVASLVRLSTATAFIRSGIHN
jgi:hypothetical protein